MLKMLKDIHGVTMIEYALIAALVAIAALTVLTTMGSNISRVFSKVNSKLSVS